MEENKRSKTFVLTFDKRYYNRDFLERLTDLEKYKLAAIDNNCSVYSSEQYSNFLNDMKPMERYVFTYIVNVL